VCARVGVGAIACVRAWQAFVAAFAISAYASTACHSSMLKPANPLLGETFEYPLRHIIMLIRTELWIG
jgi:hypothetical protein